MSASMTPEEIAELNRATAENHQLAARIPGAPMTPQEMDEIRNDPHRSGLYGKFRVERTDGKSAPGEKHDGCDYFVLDITHDPFAAPALRAYINACQGEYPNLASDLKWIIAGGAKPKEVIAENERRKLPHA